MSDHAVNATVVLVGVADSVDELIAAHASVERALSQILMPRMTRGELTGVVTRGLDTLGMKIDQPAMNRITSLSQGLPHYAHLVAQQSALEAVGSSKLRIELPHVNRAIADAVDEVERSIKDAYHHATASSRETLYPQVLLACALARGDDLGYFAAADIREPFSDIMGQEYEIPSFVQHLHALCETDRGPVLHKRGVPRRFRFRFVNPLLQPYVVMHGLNSGLLPQQLLAKSTTHP